MTSKRDLHSVELHLLDEQENIEDIFTIKNPEWEFMDDLEIQSFYDNDLDAFFEDDIEETELIGTPVKPTLSTNTERGDRHEADPRI